MHVWCKCGLLVVWTSCGYGHANNDGDLDGRNDTLICCYPGVIPENPYIDDLKRKTFAINITVLSWCSKAGGHFVVAAVDVHACHK